MDYALIRFMGHYTVGMPKQMYVCLMNGNKFRSDGIYNSIKANGLNNILC